MSGANLVGFVENAQKDETIANRLMAIPEPKNESERNEVYEKIISLGEEYGYSFTVDDCDSAWKSKEKALVQEEISKGETDPKPMHCVVSGSECVAVCGLL